MHQGVKIRALVVDGSEPCLRALADVAAAAGFEVVGTARSSEEGLRLQHELEPNLVLVDARMAGTSGYEVADRILRTHPHTTLVLSSASQPTAGRDVVPKHALTPALLRELVDEARRHPPRP